VSARISLERFLAGLDAIPGWFSLLDAHLFIAFDRLQRKAGIRGDLLEIGVYRGRSAVLLGYLLGSGEGLVGCDIFEAMPPDESNRMEQTLWYGGLTRQLFEDTYRRYHVVPPTIVAAPSVELRRHLGGMPRFRMIHVDASHTYDNVRADLATARALLIDGGIVVLDDYRAIHSPGVAAAIWRDVAETDLLPVCLTAAKMYAMWSPVPVDWDVALDEFARGHPFLRSTRVPLPGRNVLLIEGDIRPAGSAPWPAGLRRAYWTFRRSLRLGRAARRAVAR
jgi:hypothetical protein